MCPHRGSRYVDRMAAVRYACLDPGQNPDGQTDALKAADCENGSVEHACGVLARRPALDAVLDNVCAGDTPVVLELDRLGCSVRNLND